MARGYYRSEKAAAGSGHRVALYNMGGESSDGEVLGGSPHTVVGQFSTKGEAETFARRIEAASRQEQSDRPQRHTRSTSIQIIGPDGALDDDFYSPGVLGNRSFVVAMMKAQGLIAGRPAATGGAGGAHRQTTAPRAAPAPRTAVAVRVGDRVMFGRSHGEQTLGEVVRVNARTVTVRQLETRGQMRDYKVGTLWRVRPSAVSLVTGARGAPTSVPRAAPRATPAPATGGNGFSVWLEAKEPGKTMAQARKSQHRLKSEALRSASQLLNRLLGDSDRRPRAGREIRATVRDGQGRVLASTAWAPA